MSGRRVLDARALLAHHDAETARLVDTVRAVLPALLSESAIERDGAVRLLRLALDAVDQVSGERAPPPEPEPRFVPMVAPAVPNQVARPWREREDRLMPERKSKEK